MFRIDQPYLREAFSRESEPQLKWRDEHLKAAFLQLKADLVALNPLLKKADVPVRIEWFDLGQDGEPPYHIKMVRDEQKYNARGGIGYRMLTFDLSAYRSRLYPNSQADVDKVRLKKNSPNWRFGSISEENDFLFEKVAKGLVQELRDLMSPSEKERFALIVNQLPNVPSPSADPS